jgi:hypothetical protein
MRASFRVWAEVGEVGVFTENQLHIHKSTALLNAPKAKLKELYS